MSSDDFRCQAQLHLFPFGDPPIAASLLLTTVCVDRQLCQLVHRLVPQSSITPGGMHTHPLDDGMGLT